MTIQELVDRVYKTAVEKGWTEHTVEIPEQCALIHSEISEALEAYRNNEPISWTDETGKPQGIGVEYADAIIRICHYSVINGINIEAELERKMTYNATRPYRHGGKRA